MVEFRKLLSNFMISKPCFNNLAVKKILLLKSITLVHTLAKADMISIYTIGRGVRNISIKKWEIYYFKIKITPFIINTPTKRSNAQHLVEY